MIRTTLTVAGAIACPWYLRPAQATESGRALIGFQMLPTWIHFLSVILAELHQHYEPDLGQKPVVVPGNAGAQALDVVHRSSRDGATVLISPSTVLTMTPAMRKLPVDPVNDLVPVAGIGEIPFGFLVGPAVPARIRTMSEYLAWVQANPALNSYGVPGLGTAPHYIGSEISRLSQVSLRATGYRGSAALTEDVAAGSMPAGLTVILGPEEQTRFPRLRVLAVAGNRRLAHLPEIPTLREAGCAENFPGETLGFFMPSGTPEQKIAELRVAVDAATRTRAVIDAVTGAMLLPMPPGEDSYATTIYRERALWRTLLAQHEFTEQD